MCKIVDTTLRDGEQMTGVELGFNDKIEFAKIIDFTGVDIIEAGTPAMGGEEKSSIQKLMELGLNSKISAWNRMNVRDIQHSIDCRVDIIHISVPTSDIQIKWKLAQNKLWVKEQMQRCIYFAKQNDYEVVVGFEDASRASVDYLLELCREAKNLGVKQIRYADTVGILHPQKTFNEINRIKREIDIAVEFHGHNDFGMAVANSVAAVKAGAEFVDCTFGGIGERAGNCNYAELTNALKGIKI